MHPPNERLKIILDHPDAYNEEIREKNSSTQLQGQFLLY